MSFTGPGRPEFPRRPCSIVLPLNPPPGNDGKSHPGRVRAAACADSSDLECTGRTSSGGRPPRLRRCTAQRSPGGPAPRRHPGMRHRALLPLDRSRAAAGSGRLRDSALQQPIYRPNPDHHHGRGDIADMASQFLFRILEQRHDHTHLPALLSLLSRQKGRVPVSLPGPLVRRGGLRRRTDDPGRSTGAKCRSHLSFMGGGNRLSAPR